MAESTPYLSSFSCLVASSSLPKGKNLLPRQGTRTLPIIPSLAWRNGRRVVGVRLIGDECGVSGRRTSRPKKGRASRCPRVAARPCMSRPGMRLLPGPFLSGLSQGRRNSPICLIADDATWLTSKGRPGLLFLVGNSTERACSKKACNVGQRTRTWRDGYHGNA